MSLKDRIKNLPKWVKVVIGILLNVSVFGVLSIILITYGASFNMAILGAFNYVLFSEWQYWIGKIEKEKLSNGI